MLSKKVVQDIVPSSKRSLHTVKLRYIQDEKENNEDTNIEEIKKYRDKERKTKNNRKEKDYREEVINKKTKNKFSIKLIISFLIIFLCIAIIGIAISLLYTKGVVIVTPVTQDLIVDGTFTVKKDALSDELKYEVVTISEEQKKSIPATEGPLIQTKAKGIIILYNTSTSTISQKIIAGTRISSPEGLIYRTTSTVFIPIQRTISGKKVPGTVSVGIIADKAGSEYNKKSSTITSAKFRIVAFKDSNKYESFYGYLKTEILGGFLGTNKIISDEIKKKTEIELQNELKFKLLSKINTIIPKDYTYFNNAYSIEFKTLEPADIVSGLSNITVQGTLYGIIFNNDLLLKKVATKEIKTFPAKTYTIKGLNELKFNINNTKDFSAKKGNQLSFTLKGNVSLTGTFSEENLKNDLMGIKLKDINTILRKYGSISNAYAIITPFWMRTFPNSIEHIKIEYK